MESHNPDRQLYNRSTRSILFALGRDTRDYRTSLFDPTAGSFNTLSYEYSGGILGADNKFQKYYADTSWFYSGWWNHVIAVHGRAGLMRSESSDAYFLFYERFFLGGVDSIRGYEDWESILIQMNRDLSIPTGVIRYSSQTLSTVSQFLSSSQRLCFFDIGQVWDESTTNVFSEINMKKGLGLEARSRCSVC